MSHYSWLLRREEKKGAHLWATERYIASIFGIIISLAFLMPSQRIFFSFFLFSLRGCLLDVVYLYRSCLLARSNSGGDEFSEIKIKVKLIYFLHLLFFWVGKREEKKVVARLPVENEKILRNVIMSLQLFFISLVVSFPWCFFFICGGEPRIRKHLKIVIFFLPTQTRTNRENPRET